MTIPSSARICASRSRSICTRAVSCPSTNGAELKNSARHHALACMREFSALALHQLLKAASESRALFQTVSSTHLPGAAAKKPLSYPELASIATAASCAYRRC